MSALDIYLVVAVIMVVASLLDDVDDLVRALVWGAAWPLYSVGFLAMVGVIALSMVAAAAGFLASRLERALKDIIDGGPRG